MTIAPETLQSVLDKSDPNTLADALRLTGLGARAAVVKVVATGLTAGASFDITTAAVKAASTITGIDPLHTGELLPPIAQVVSLRVAASGTPNSVGTYVVGDTGSTMVSPTAGANVGIARLSDDGKTITFLTTVTAFTLTYVPRSKVAVTSVFAPSV
jgi:hypothetical protein